MQREPRVFLEDILVAAIKVAKYIKGLSFIGKEGDPEWAPLLSAFIH
jgi:uncharacterized protein with HEPN domain